MAKKRKKQSKGDPLIVILIGTLIIFVIKLLTIIYHAISIHTSKYKSKSGNGFFKTYFNKGNYGEYQLYKRILRQFKNEKVYTNVYLDNVNTDQTEVDVIAVSQHGVYVFEMKNYSGYIYGSIRNQHWTQVINRATKNKFYNPLRQNYAHTKAIENYLEISNDEIIPVVVFADRSNINNVETDADIKIVKLKEVNKLISQNFKTREAIFSNQQMKDFSIKLLEKSNMPESVRAKHIEQVKELASNNQ